MSICVESVKSKELKKILQYISSKRSESDLTEEERDKIYREKMFVQTIKLIDKMYSYKTDQDKYTVNFDKLKDFTIYSGIFSPKFAEDSIIWAESLVKNKHVYKKSILEMGTGTGIVAIYCSLFGNTKQTMCIDVNSRAVNNCVENKNKYNLQEAFFVVKQSDLFQNINKKKKFDVILWSFTWTFLDDESIINKLIKVNDKNLQMLIRAFIDPYYLSMKRFLKDSRKHLNDNGKIILLSSDFCRNDIIKQCAKNIGYFVQTDTIAKNEQIVSDPNMVTDLYNVILEY